LIDTKILKKLDGIPNEFESRKEKVLRLSEGLGQSSVDPSQEVALLKEIHLRFVAFYLTQLAEGSQPLDPVARFHLGNGARIERLNWYGDPSTKGLKQSFGMMVNYLYDLKRLDRARSSLLKGKVAQSAEIESLLKR
jgi:malonyl-CoA decarboxylase